MTKSAETAHDLVVFGATSFVGQILTRYLLETYGVGKSVNGRLPGAPRVSSTRSRASLATTAKTCP